MSMSEVAYQTGRLGLATISAGSWVLLLVDGSRQQGSQLGEV